MAFRNNSRGMSEQKAASNVYRKAIIPKGKSGFRCIYIPSPEFATALRKNIPELEGILKGLDADMVNYAFTKGRNCALNAFRHVGKRFLLSFDLQDFFNTITISHVENIIPKRIIDVCFVDGNPKQGLPTSPIISSIAFSACDKEILALLKEFGVDAIYTRYADDLSFSFDDPEEAKKIESVVGRALSDHGFVLNEKKTRLQDLRNGRIIINGIGIDSSGVHPTRRTLKKLRAAKHQKNTRSARGLAEWAACKFPANLKLKIIENTELERREVRRDFIRNCSWGYSCKMSWSQLDQTDDPKIRFCGSCQREVYHSVNGGDLIKNVALNRCVYFSSDLIAASPRPGMLMGSFDDDLDF